MFTNVWVEDENIEKQLDKPTLSVYDKGSTVDMTFLPNRAEAPEDTFHGGRAQLIAARIDGDQEVPESQEELGELVSNDAATFYMEDDRAVDIHSFELGGATVDGDVFSFEPEQSGQYVLFLAAPEDWSSGFEVNDGDISKTGDVTIFGMDAVTVHETSSIVDPKSVESGSNATFDVETSGASTDDVNHTLVLYDEDTFGSASNTFILDNATAETNVEVETDIKDVNGVVRVENESDVFIADASDHELSPSMELSAIADTILANRSNVTVREDAVVLDASLTAKQGSANDEIEVGIPDDWDGEYRWIHVATTADGSIVGSNAGDVTVGPDEDDGDGPSGPPSSPPSDPPSDTPADPPVSVNIDREDGRVSISIENAEANKSVRIEVNTVGSGPASPTLDELNASFSEDTDASLEVNGDRGSTPPVNAETDLGYFNVSHDVSDEATGPVTFSFRVASDRLDERGVDPGDVTLYRYHDGEWHTLETRHLGSAGGDERFEADSPGLSVFAVSTRSAQDPAFEVTDASVDAGSAEVGETVAVTATVENSGSSEGTYTAELAIDGETVERQDVTVPAGESKTVTFTHAFDEAGTYDVAVGGVAAGTVEVTAADTPTETPTTGTDGTTTTAGPTPTDLVGGGSLAAVVVLVLLVLAGAVAFLYRSGRFDDLR